MLLPTSSIDGTDAILHAIDAQLISTHTHYSATLEMRRIGHGVISFLVALPGDPGIAKDRDRPVS